MDGASARKPRSLAKSLVFASIPLAVLLVALELGVRVLRLDQDCPNSYSEGGMWACDPILNFKLSPDLIAGGKPLNRAGFRSREFTPKPAGVFRVLSLGDSWTFGIISTAVQPVIFIPEPYPQRLERLVAERVGPGRVEVLNAGVAGYNSFQGLMLLRSKLRGREPDLITVRFGWNDHFMSAGIRRLARQTCWPRPQDLMLRTSLTVLPPPQLELQALARARIRRRAERCRPSGSRTSLEVYDTTCGASSAGRARAPRCGCSPRHAS
jgi:lysophospholipase L1-like esterase